MEQRIRPISKEEIVAPRYGAFELSKGVPRAIDQPWNTV